MDKLSGETKLKVSHLRKQCNEYDALLRHFAIPHTDLSPSMQKDLDDYAQFKKKLGVYAMELSFLSELYCTNAEQNIAKKITILKAIAFNEKIEKKLAETNSKLADVKRFVDSTRNVVKHSNIDRSISEANREINALVEKKNKLEENVKIDLDQVLMKLDQLA